MLRISEFILNFVLNSAWQVAAIFVFAAAASWLLRNGPARYRHTLWIIALIASLVVPLLTVTRVVPEWISSFQLQLLPNPRMLFELRIRMDQNSISQLITPAAVDGVRP